MRAWPGPAVPLRARPEGRRREPGGAERALQAASLAPLLEGRMGGLRPRGSSRDAPGSRRSGRRARGASVRRGRERRGPGRAQAGGRGAPRVGALGRALSARAPRNRRAMRVTLADFKNVLSNRPVHAYKFFFKSMDQDFGVVKEEILDDNAKLPCLNGRVVSWLVLAEGAHSDAGSQGTDSHTDLPPPLERTGGIRDSRPPSFHPNVASSRDPMHNEKGMESMVSHQRERARRWNREEAAWTNAHPRGDQRRDVGLPPDSTSTALSCELESSSFVDSDEDGSTSRLSSSTEQSTSSRLIRKHKRGRRKQRLRQTDRASSFSSITDSTMSPNIITVTLNMERHHFLGISIVGQSNDRGGIYIVAADGRIEPGDMLLQVNDMNFENMSNDEAGPSAFRSPCSSAVTRTGPSSLTSSVPGAPQLEEAPLQVKSDMGAVVRVMQLPDSGLEIRDRMWLKITIANAVIGADVVDWLYTHVEGFKERWEARKYASSLLKHGLLRHTVKKITFSEQCYYIFGDLCSNLVALNLNSGSSGASDQNTLAPLPHLTTPWPLGQGYPYQYPGPPALLPTCLPGPRL
ncbi:Segment polarity protein dishevelled DVL-1 [Saguinus oedipus]|uniref:Segment polarity protein dishevelled DVL-1 n=1 Tax=Saguinus oedipus TaxID=9490 RepID=A0ABQ9VLJ2_SAGOE|nr:Segment polarity protein dishevelled DVL-1 [Saguinus oedipus]